MVGLVVAGIVLVAVVLFVMRFRAGARLSTDPHQHELAFLLMRAVLRPEGAMVQDENGHWAHSNGAPLNFISGWQDVTSYAGQQFKELSAHERRLRLAHALTLAQRGVKASDYDTLRHMVAGYRG